MDEGHWNLLWVGGLALEEARIERQVARLGFPPADAVDYEHLGYRLYGLCEKALAVSIRRSNIGCEEGFEFFSWGVEAKGCSGAVVEFISDRVEVGLVAGDVGPLG